MTTGNTLVATAPAGTSSWQIDASHSQVEFAVKHLMISNVKGRFTDVQGTINVDGSDPGKAEIDVVIGAASIDTRQEQRDAHLRSADFFDTDQFPQLTYKSRRIEGNPFEGDFRVIGDLTIRGVTREVALDVTSEGLATDPWGNERAGFAARTKIDRKDYGLTYNQALEAGGVVVGNEIKISIEVELVRQAAVVASAA